MTWHTVKEAAPLLGVGEETVYLLCASGRLAHRRIGLKPGRGRIQVSDANIAAFLESCEVAAKDATAPQVKGKPGRPKTPTFSGRPDGKPIKLPWCR